MLKRTFDVGFSLIALVATSPVFVVVAIVVKFDTPGGVFFRQRRVGLEGQEFEIFQFRTMSFAPSGAGPQITVGADSRITRSGAWLRRYKIDELPQFLNVLRGDMSVVGPRPEVPRYVAMYLPAIRARVLSVRPGITDLASIEFRNESELLARAVDPERAYVEEVLPAKLALCERYVAERSFGGDLVIIARTLKAAIFPRA